MGHWQHQHAGLTIRAGPYLGNDRAWAIFDAFLTPRKELAVPEVTVSNDKASNWRG
jgi:hypothetical protein